MASTLLHRIFRRFWRDVRGATIIEFAVVAPMFFLIMFGIIEYGLYMFHKVAIESITMQAGREATLGKTAGNGECSGTKDRVTYIQCVVRTKSAGLIRGEDTIINVNTVAAGGTFKPDICIQANGRATSAPATCNGPNEHYLDINGSGSYEGASAVSDVGAAGAIVEVQVLYPWKVLIPFMARFFSSEKEDGSTTGVVMIRSSTVVKNEPFGPAGGGGTP